MKYLVYYHKSGCVAVEADSKSEAIDIVSDMCAIGSFAIEDCSNYWHVDDAEEAKPNGRE